MKSGARNNENICEMHKYALFYDIKMIVIVFGENETNLTRLASDLVCTQDTSEWIDFVTISTSDWIDNMMDYTDSVTNLLCNSGICNYCHHLLIVLS